MKSNLPIAIQLRQFHQLNPLIKTVAFIPTVQAAKDDLTSNLNRDVQYQLERKLSGLFFGMERLDRETQSTWPGLMVSNIPEDYAIDLGILIQQTFIFHGKITDTERFLIFHFKRILCHDPGLKNKVKGYENCQGLVTAERIYIVPKNPFQDAILQTIGSNFPLPVFDELLNNRDSPYLKSPLKFLGTYSKIPNLRPAVEKKIKSLITETVLEGKIPKWGWTRRGMALNLLNQYIERESEEDKFD